jgi:hypothetical protein
MIREYCHLKLLKHGGSGYDGRGVAETLGGELAVMCPVCPRPGINLPDNWENASADLLYAFLHLYYVICHTGRN